MTIRLHRDRGRPRRRSRRLIGVLVGAVLVGVLAAVGAIGLAVAAPARTVTITVDDGTGAPSSTAVRTGADRVSEVLVRAGVTVRPGDLVEPAEDRSVGSDDAIRITRAMRLDLVIDGRPRQITTLLRTVGQLLESLDLPDGSRAVVPDDRELRTAPRPLAIATPKLVTITADGRTRTVRTAAPTVRQAVTEQGIRLGPRDQIAPDGTGVPTADLRITVTRIGSGPTVEQREQIPFGTEVRQDPTRFAGETTVLREGRPGEIVRIYRTRTVNGEPRGRMLVGSRTVLEPVSRIVSVGTLDRPGQPAPGNPGLGDLGPLQPAPTAPAPPAPGQPEQYSLPQQPVPGQSRPTSPSPTSPPTSPPISPPPTTPPPDPKPEPSRPVSPPPTTPPPTTPPPAPKPSPPPTSPGPDATRSTSLGPDPTRPTASQLTDARPPGRDTGATSRGDIDGTEAAASLR